MAERALIIFEKAENGRMRQEGVFGYISPAAGSFEELDGRVVHHEGFTIVPDDSRGSNRTFVTGNGEIYELMSGEPDDGQWLLFDDRRVVHTFLTSPRGV